MFDTSKNYAKFFATKFFAIAFRTFGYKVVILTTF